MNSQNSYCGPGNVYMGTGRLVKKSVTRENNRSGGRCCDYCKYYDMDSFSKK